MSLSIEEKVIEIIARQAVLEPSDIALDATPESLGIDSLGLVEAVFAIEESFGVEIPFNANTPEAPGFDISTVAAIVQEVEKLVRARR